MLSSFLLLIFLQAEGKGAAGDAQEPPWGGNWAPQERDWTPTEGDRPPQGQNQKVEAWWLKLVANVSKHPSLFFPSQRLPAIDWLYCRSEQDHKRPNDKNLKIKCFVFENACRSLTNTCMQWSVFCVYIGSLRNGNGEAKGCSLNSSWIKRNGE